VGKKWWFMRVIEIVHLSRSYLTVYYLMCIKGKVPRRAPVLGEERVTSTEDVGFFGLSKLMAFECCDIVAAVKDMLSTLAFANDADLVTTDIDKVFGSAGDIDGEARDTLDRKINC
jgi:hypothetical protein